MSKCAKCLDYYHPDYIVYQEVRGDMIKVCAFCRLDKKELTITEEDGKVINKVTKKQASINYKRWVDELRKNPKIAKIVQGEANEQRNSIKR